MELDKDLIINDNDGNRPTDNDGFDLSENRDGMFRKPRKNRGKKIALIVIIAVLSLALIAGIVFGVLHFFGGDEYDNTSQFYFSSDLLNEDGNEYTVYGEISFNVNNFADELRVSGQDIEDFTVKAESEGKDITSLCTVTVEKHTLTAGDRDTSKVTVSVPENYYDTPIEISVESQPINIIIKGTFTVLPMWGSEIADESGNVSLKLTLWANEETTLLVKWDKSKLIGDKTDAYVKASDTDGECAVTLAAGSGTEMFFFKTDMTADYSEKKGVLTVEKTDLKKYKSSKTVDASKSSDTTNENDTTSSGEGEK